MRDVQNICGPFVRWAGGKRWFCSRIKNYLPTSFSDYYEPFLGGGSVFFQLFSMGLIKHDCYLSDLNNQLVKAYNEVRDNPSRIVEWFKGKKYTKEEYYEIRTHFNAYPSSPTASEEFLYLNRMGYNGVYRVNKLGDYNVPFGNRKPVQEEYYDLIRNDSTALQNALIKKKDYKHLLSECYRPNSFFFIDPPYTVSHNNNGFIAYNKKLFSLDDQRTLYKVLKRIDSLGCYFLMTNAHHIVIEEIFGEFNLFEEKRPSLIGGKNALRQSVSEYIICNYEIEGNDGK